VTSKRQPWHAVVERNAIGMRTVLRPSEIVI
jgi:hypothetical protein